MSLLLDALKKAEEAKRRKREAEEAGEAAPSTDANTSAEAPDAAFPSLALEDEAPAAGLTTEPPTLLVEAPEADAQPIEQAPLEFAPIALGEGDQHPSPASAPSADTPEAPVLSLPPLELPGAPVIQPPPSATQAASVLELSLLPSAGPRSAPPAAQATTPPPEASAELTLPPLAAAAPTAQPPEEAAPTEGSPAAPKPNLAAAERFSGRTGRFGASGSEAPHDASTEPRLPPLAQPVIAARPERSTAGPATRDTAPQKAETAPPPISAAAARQLFDAKQTPKRGLSTQQRAALLFIPLILIAVGGGAYLWWTLNQVSSGLAVPSQANAPAAPAAVASVAPAAPPADAPTGAAGNKAPSPPATPSPTEESASATPPGPSAPEAPRLPVQPKHGDRARVIEIPTQLAAEDVHFAHSSTPPSVPAAVSQGYQAYQQGNYAAAAEAYRQQLAADPNNRDALLGLAAVALQRQQVDEARAYYQQLASIDPKDDVAQAALASLGAEANPEQAEARLKRSFESQPTPEVATALGGLMARQKRWNEAQDYYFKAYTASPDEPDYAYNLAISLDALGQGKLARNYYERALTLGARKPGSFKRDEARRRMAELAGS
ncbi:MAG: tetratricopeptide repeat protein [Burkholderiales bacterium]|nr:tetratricopeptide repeat protein [Burkholderiales bacterium]